MTTVSKIFLRACPVCGFDRGLFLHNQKFVLPDNHPLRGGYDIVICGKCNFLFADSEVSQADYDLYYSDFSKYEDNNTSTGGGETGVDSLRIKEVAVEIDRHLKRQRKRILDIGCANGGILRELKKLGYDLLVGVDPSKACVNHIKANLGIEAHRASLFDMPDILGTFDLVILSHVLEHIHDLKEGLKMVSKIVNSNGMVYVEVPDAMRYVDFITSPFQDFNTEHINHFTEASLDNLFLHNGFKKIRGGTKTLESAPGMPYPALFSFYGKDGAVVKSDYVKDNQIDESIGRYIRNSQTVIDRINEFLNRNFKPEESILVWGTGQLTMKLLAMSDLRKLHIINFIDSNPILKNKSLNEIRIIHPSEIGKDLERFNILITSTIHEQAIRADMIQKYKLKNVALGLGGCLN